MSNNTDSTTRALDIRQSVETSIALLDSRLITINQTFNAIKEDIIEYKKSLGENAHILAQLSMEVRNIKEQVSQLSTTVLTSADTALITRVAVIESSLKNTTQRLSAIEEAQILAEASAKEFKRQVLWASLSFIGGLIVCVITSIATIVGYFVR